MVSDRTLAIYAHVDDNVWHASFGPEGAACPPDGALKSAGPH
jgi:hypothetical protein